MNLAVGGLLTTRLTESSSVSPSSSVTRRLTVIVPGAE